MRTLTILLVVAICLVGVTAAGAEGEDKVSPDRISATLRAGECANEKVQLTTGAAAIPRLDVAIVMDVTGSMSDEIAAVQRRATEIVGRVKELVPQTRFAVATVADYAEVKWTGNLFDLLGNLVSFGDPGDYPWRIETDFTSDAAKVQAAVNGIGLKSGGDGPESYLRALSEARGLSWLHDSRRIIVFFGDSIPHDPDPGPDAAMSTADDLTQDNVTKSLQDQGISVIGIYTTQGFSDFYQRMASATGGQTFALPSADQAPEAVVNLLKADVRTLRNVTLRPEAAYTGWLTWTPAVYPEVGANQTVTWDVQLCRPSGAADGEQHFNLAVVGSGSALYSIPVTVRAPAVVSGLPAWLPFLGIIPVGLLLFALVRWLTRPKKRQPPRGGGSSPRPARPTPTPWKPTNAPRPRAPGGKDVTPDR